MALTRKMLTAMGIEADKIDQIIESHTDTVDGLKKQADDLREQAQKVPSLEKEIEDLKAAQPTEDWEAKYNELKSEYEDYKTKVANEQADQEKARLYRALLREQGVDEKRIDSIMKVTDLSGVAVEDGALSNSEGLSEAITKEWGDFIATTTTKGATVDTPPANAGGKMTKEDIRAIKDASKRQAAIAENIELFQ